MKTFDEELTSRKMRLAKVLDEHCATSDDPALDEMLQTVVKNRRHIFAFGNGGSYAQASHFVAELVGLFENSEGDNANIPASVLLNASLFTALVNDLYSPWKAPSMALSSNGNTGDLLVVLSTSGKSKNIVELCRVAKIKGIQTILLTGDAESRMGETRAEADFELTVPSDNTATIQEVHQVMLHAIAAVIKGATCEQS